MTGRLVSLVRVRVVDALHPDITRVLVGFEEGDVAAVRRDLRTGDLGIAEEKFAIEQRRDFAGLSGSDQRSAEGDGQRDGPAIDERPHVCL